MPPTWSELNFELVTTEDQSPTLRNLDKKNQECMHHSGGAYSESLYIYGEAIEKTLQQSSGLNFLSVGLGLGYNEFLVAKLSLDYNFSQDLFLQSFEIHPVLQEYFIKFIHNENLPAQIYETYTQVLNFTSAKKNPDKIKDLLVQKYTLKKFILSSKLDCKLLAADKKFNCILYDAFSQKTSPELWSEEFLNDFLGHAAAKTCVFSTYACMGNLKRTLKKNNFTVLERPGFKGKRNCTLASRGI